MREGRGEPTHVVFIERVCFKKKSQGSGAGRPALHSWWKHLLTGIMIPTVTKVASMESM